MSRAEAISTICLVLVLWMGAVPMRAQTPLYDNDFETGTTAGWSTVVGSPVFQAPIRTTTPPIGGRFLGEFGDQTVRLDLPVPQPHDTIRVVFDLYVIQTWDGNMIDASGPDVWSMGLAGDDPVVQTTFNNTGQATQAYPDSWPDGVNRFRSGATGNNVLGYTGFGDARYHFDLRIPHTGSSLSLEFTAALREAANTAGLANESWGLDNISISTILAPVIVPSATIEAGVVAGAPGEIIELPIRLRHARALGQSSTLRFTGALRFDASLLLPIDHRMLGTVSNGERSIPLDLPGTTGPDSILTTIRFHVALGDTTSTDLVLEGFTSTGAVVQLEMVTGRFSLSDYCSAGGTPRLVSMGGGSMIKASSSGGVLTVDFTLAEDGPTKLLLFDALGSRVATLSDDIAIHGDHRRTFDATGLPAGIYHLVLHTGLSTATTRVDLLP